MRDHEIERAFGAFVGAESDRLQRFASYMCGDPDLARDLVQEALLRTFASWRRIRTTDPRSYARRIVVNQLKDKRRRDRVRRLRPVATLAPTEREVDDATLDWIVLADLLRTLPTMRRAVVLLRFYEDMTEQQIADVLDRPIGTVKSDLHRALAALRPLLSPSLPADAKGSA